ncbi:MAG: Coenzyme PQQ synthesis protein E [Myxococcota bacterium]|nr:Coenzyme PQQ synthesis protein E [Myxococcota bacterium]
MAKPFSDHLRDALFNVSRKINYPLTPPDWVSVNVTLRCNLACTMCTTCYPEPDNLTTAEIRGIIRQTASWGVKTFNPIGGEPFVRKDMIDILEYAHAEGLWVTVTTNGTLITDDIARRLAAINHVHMNVSIDGDREANDAVRGKGVYDKAIRTIENVRRFEAELRAENPHFWPKEINVNCIINNRNFRGLIPFVEEVKRAGASKIQFLNLFGYEEKRGTPVTNPLWFTPDLLPGLDQRVDELIEYVKNDRSGFKYVNSVGDLLLIKRYYRGQLKPHNAICYNGFKEFYINANGDGLMCDGHLNFTADTFGNIRHMTLKDMWTSPKARRMRDKVIHCGFACIQDCYLRHDSDSLGGIGRRAGGQALGEMAERARRSAAAQMQNRAAAIIPMVNQ